MKKFSVSPYFLVGWKENAQLTDQIDNAIFNINIQKPGADDALMLKYFPSIIGTPMTKEKQNLIEENKSCDVYFDADTKSTSWYDEETGTIHGRPVEVCRQLTEIMGLKLNPVPMFAGKTKLDDTVIRTNTD